MGKGKNMNRTEQASQIGKDKIESDKETVNRIVIEKMVEGFAKHDIDLIMQQFADDAVYYDMHGEGISGQTYRGIKEIRQVFEGYFSSLPNHTYEDAKIVVSGDQVHANWDLVIGDQRKQNQLYKTRGSDYFELKDGKVVVKNAWIMNINKLRIMVMKARLKEFLTFS